MNPVNCPECEAELSLASGSVIGEIIVCPDCGLDLEILALDPAEINLAPMVEEDWGE